MARNDGSSFKSPVHVNPFNVIEEAGVVRNAAIQERTEMSPEPPDIQDNSGGVPAPLVPISDNPARRKPKRGLKIEKKEKKPRFIDLHKLTSVYMRKDLVERFEKAVAFLEAEYGQNATYLWNYSLERSIIELENEMLEKK